MDAFPQLNRIATDKGCSPEGLVLAYMQAKWPCVQHITSARRLAHLKDTLNSSSIAVSAEEIAAIDQDGDQGEARDVEGGERVQRLLAEATTARGRQHRGAAALVQ